MKWMMNSTVMSIRISFSLWVGVMLRLAPSADRLAWLSRLERTPRNAPERHA